MAEHLTHRQKKRTRTARKQLQKGAKVIKVRSEDTLAPKFSKRLVKQGYDYKHGAWRKGGGGGGKKGKHGLNKKLEKSAKRVAVYDPSRALKGRDLRRGVRALVRLQTRPAVRELSREIGQMKGSQQREIQRAELLRQQATGNAQTYYGQLAQENQQAIGQQQQYGQELTGNVQQQQASTQAAIAAAGAAAQQRTGNEPQGQEITARDQLAAMIAQQQGAAAREAAAQQSLAQGQASGFSALQTGLGMAQQMRGASQIGDITQNVLNQEADIRDRYGRDISQVRGKRSDLLAQRPDLAGKAFMDLRESERNYLLSRAAIGEKKFEAMLGAKADKAASKSGIKYSNVSTKNYMKLNKQKAALELKRAKAAGASNKELAAIKAKYARKYLKLQQQGSGGGGGGGGGGGENYISYKKGKAYLQNLDGFHPKQLRSKSARKKAYNKLRVYGVGDKRAKKIIHDTVHSWKRNKGYTSRTRTERGQRVPR